MNADFHIRKNENVSQEELLSLRTKHKLNIRKKCVDEYIMKKRMNLVESSPNKEFDFSKTKITENYLQSDFINSIITQNNCEKIFAFINDQSTFPYGIHLLKEKLTNSENITEQNIQEILNRGLIDIVKRVFSHSQARIEAETNQNSIPTGDEDDSALLIKVYLILVNFSFYAKDEEDAILVSDELMKYHLYFLGNCSDDEVISNIISLFANISLDNFELCSKIYSPFVEETVADTLNGAIAHMKTGIIQACSEFYCSVIYTFFTCENCESFLEQIERIYGLLINLLNVDECYSNCLWAISQTFLIMEKHQKLAEDSGSNKMLFSMLLNSKELFTVTFSKDYLNFFSDGLSPFCKLITFFISYYNNAKFEKGSYLKEIFDFLLDEKDVLTVLNNFLKGKIIKESKIVVLKTILALIQNPIAAKKFLSHSILKTVLSNCRSSFYEIRNESLNVIYELCKLKVFNIGNVLVNEGIFDLIQQICVPDNICMPGEDIALCCLEIADSIFEKGEMLRSINGRNPFFDKFEEFGGIQLLERMLGHPKKNVFVKSEEIMNKYYEKIYN